MAKGRTALVELEGIEADGSEPVKMDLAPAKPKADDFPYGYLVKHPSFGSLRIRKEEASTEDEAIEAYRKAKCPQFKNEFLKESGARVGVLAFRPAETERGS